MNIYCALMTDTNKAGCWDTEQQASVRQAFSKQTHVRRQRITLRLLTTAKTAPKHREPDITRGNPAVDGAQASRGEQPRECGWNTMV